MGRIYDIKPNTEEFLCPLQMRERGSEMVGVGNGFIHVYDMERLKPSVMVRSILKKNDYCSSIAVPDAESESYNQTKEIIAVGTFNRLIKLINI